MSRAELKELISGYRNNADIELVNYTELGNNSKCISLRATGGFGFPTESKHVHAIGLDMQKISVAFVLKTEKK
tara:strand:- start:529 stop:747 length:219 start_codon:yes stop_codon:yes gene_type:complete